MNNVYRIFIGMLLLQAFWIEVVHCATTKTSQYEINQIEDLPQSEVNVVYEDKHGFIWIGTLDGLFRYDGHDYRSYQLNNAQQSLKSNMILAIDEDSDGNIWIGTYGQGMSRVNPQTEEVTNYEFHDFLPKNIKFNDAVSIEVDRDDNIWIANWYYILKVKLGDLTNDIDYITCYPISSQDIQNKNFVNVIHEDRDGNIWFGSNLTTQRLIEERGDELICEKFAINCVDICDYSDDAIIIAGNNLVMLKRDSDKKEYQSTHLKKLSSATKVTCEDSLNIWVGTRNGVSHIHKKSDNKWIMAMRYTKENIPFNMPSNIVSSMMLNKEKQVWVGTRGGGVFTIGSKVKPFNNFPISTRGNSAMASQIIKAMYEDSNGGLWIGTEENGIYYHRYFGAKPLRISVNSSDDRAYTFEQTGDSSTREVMWVGTSFPANLVAIDMNTLRPIEQKQTLPQIGFVFALRKSDSNTLWAGTYNNGLWRLTIDDYGHIVSSQQFTTMNSDINSDIIRSLYITSNGDLLIGTDIGINRISEEDFHSEKPTIWHNLHRDKSTTLSHYVLQIMESRQGDLFIGTMGHGLFCYNVESDSISNLTTDDGLTNNSVKSIIEDPKSGDIWLSTNRGISRYMPSNGSVINFDKNDGLRDCEFSEVCGVYRSNGNILFGNRFGFTSFTPSEIKPSNVTPKLHFTNLYINHKLVHVGVDPSNEREILSKTLEYTQHIDLEYNERNFSVGFVGLNFISPLSNSYYVKLEGMESEWRKINGSELVAQYTNIPEGEYNFRVRAMNSDGVWSNDELNLGIHINPPLSRSKEACIVYIIILALLLYVAFWIFSYIAKRKRQVLIAQMEQKRTEDMVQYKLEFFTNISHEFRTPLTLINIPLEKMMSNREQIQNPEMVEDLSEMKYNVDMLLSLVNQLLDFRKIEQGKVYIKPVATNVVTYLQSYFNIFNMLAQKQNIDYQFRTSEKSIAVDIDSRLFDKVVVNILSNAFKFTPSGGCIEMTIERDEVKNSIILKLQDNGKGIAKDEIPFLFDQFYQGKNQNANTTYGAGSGMGLSLTKRIVELHHGHMYIESDTNQGFLCVIELPLSTHEGETTPHNEEPFVVIDQLPRENNHEVVITNSGNRDLILIVDDNNQLRNQLSKQLNTSYDIITAENGEVGLNKCLSELPSLVIADIMMPVMDGIEMCRRIKEDESISHTPIMVLTANTTVKNQIDSFTIGGADGYLDKPFNLDILKSKIATILQNRAILKEKFQKQSIINPEEFVTSPADLKYLSKIVGIIKERIGDSELSIEDIAAEYGVSRTYLNRKIKALTDVTATQFLRNIRMKYAAKLLLQKQMNVTEVAWRVGYTDARAFRIRFKEVYGVSPTNYNGEDPIVKESSNIENEIEI